MNLATPLLLVLLTSTAVASDYVPPEAAFDLSLQRVAAGRYVLQADVMPGFALYQDKLKLSADGGDIRGVQMPPGTVIDDPELGVERVLNGRVAIPVAVDVRPGQAATLTVRYQGCQVDRFCYPPQTVRFELGSH